MGRRKGKKTTLTKIDPSILCPKPPAVSQHADDNGVPVTTAVNPPSPSWMPTEEPDIFNPDASNYLGDDVSEEEIAAEWHTDHVSSLVFSNRR